MNLDLRTMMVMIAVLSFLFSILLSVASLHARGVQGLRHWAMASLCISLGSFIAFPNLHAGQGWPVVAGAALLAAGSVTQLVGIQAFKGEPSQLRWMIAIVVLVGFFSYWFSLVQVNVQFRAVVNSLVFAAIDFNCARALLIRLPSPERTAHWLTGASFAALSLIYTSRAIAIYSAPPGAYHLFSPMLINPVMFFAGSVIQLFLTFGFILMVNYRMASQLENLATTDALTGTWNRRSLELELQRMLARSQRRREPMSVVMLDVDHFKLINDSHGHRAGDEVLRQLTARARLEIRRDDYLARYGGEEFCLLLPGTSELEAQQLAERLRRIHAEQAVDWRGTPISSSISIGIASSEHTGLNGDALLEAADAALYRAKQTGRNRAETFSQFRISPA